nr:cobalamin biosynthesis protein [Nocardioides perillae]
MSPDRSRAAGLLLGLAADRWLGDPERGHPVAAFGRLAAALERRWWADSVLRGLGHALVLTGGTALAGVAVERATARHPVTHAAATAVATWVVLGGTTLGREAAAVEGFLEVGDLPAARAQVGRIVGRSTTALDEAGVARAAVESAAENTADAAVAPLLWGAVAGVPGLLGYRAANTLDAMVGHRSPRHDRFGRASARLDDLLNLPASRLTGALAAGLAPTVGGRPRAALAAWRRDAAAHPSPNAGVVEAAFAGALGVALGGETPYPYGTQHRPLLGAGPAPGAHDVRRAVALSTRVQVAAGLACAALAARRGRSSESPVSR